MGAAKQDSATFNMTCLLREWDRAPKEKRRQLLQDFIDQHCNRSGPELELELAQMASLFLARICVWVKLTWVTISLIFCLPLCIDNKNQIPAQLAATLCWLLLYLQHLF